jgi:hypothetical protein
MIRTVVCAKSIRFGFQHPEIVLTYSSVAIAAINQDGINAQPENQPDPQRKSIDEPIFLRGTAHSKTLQFLRVQPNLESEAETDAISLDVDRG